MSLAVLGACELIDRTIRTDPRFARTSHVRVLLGDEAVFDRHYRGPAAGDVFSVTKTVLACLTGIAVGDGRIRDLDAPVGPVLGLAGTPADRQSWRHLLTMTRGAETGGAWDGDEIARVTCDLANHIARAPQLDQPGRTFRYDNAGAHLLAAALAAVCGDLRAFAAERLFTPLGIADWAWKTDPEGVPFGFAHLTLSAEALGRVGRMLLTGELLPAGYLAELATPWTGGGPPEQRPYGYLTWIDEDGVLFAGGWAGQLVMVVPAAGAVVVTTGDPGFDPGPPPSDQMPDGWQAPLELVRRHLLPALRPLRAG